MPLRLFNTLTRREEAFVPLAPPKVGMYVCGPTVYAPPHIGNLRTFVFADVLHRYLEWRGYDVTFVMNLTDVDDKTIAGARAAGVPLRAYTEPFVAAFFRDLDRLGIRRADVYPRATEHIPQMIALVERLLSRGLAYVAGDGSVYFSIARFPEYGKLSRIDLSGVRPGERVAVDEYGKDDARDFALWKAAKPEDEEVGAAWDTPWGRGRPGWHIECSAMSMAYLGETLDIHGGGVDLIFPHHEDEIAQSEGATGKPFVRYWLHAEHLLVHGAKMAKSLGNVYTLDDLLGRGVRPSALRYFFLTAQYRSKLNFTWEALEAATEAVDRARRTRARLRSHPGSPRPDPALPPWLDARAEAALAAFRAGMDDDLNTPVALAALHGFLPEINARLDELGQRPIDEVERRAALDALERMDQVVGFLALADAEHDAAHAELAAWVEERLREREAARRARDWARADAIRAELAARGVVVEDTPQGPRWRWRG